MRRKPAMTDNEKRLNEMVTAYVAVNPGITKEQVPGIVMMFRAMIMTKGCRTFRQP